jgi:RNA polymerase sigma-70 factor (ECF subfamily)
MARKRTTVSANAPRTLSEAERNYVFSVAMKYVKDEDAAADVTQDALLLAHRHRGSFRGDSRYSTWLYRIAATTALMHLRKQRRKAREVLVPHRVGEDERVNELDGVSPGPTPEEMVAHREAMAIVDERLAELGDKYADVFVLRFLEGYSESEIAERLDLNVAPVKTRAYRARLAVRERLAADDLPAAA